MTACGKTSIKAERWVIGTVSYGKEEQAISKYETFKRYFEEKTRSLVELEPTFNENKALERIKSQAWSLVFAPPGLAAIAMTEHQYIPLLPLQEMNNRSSILVVRQDSPFTNLHSLTGQVVALGQPGSATGYYIPLFNLYGLTLAEVIFSPSSYHILEAVAENKAAAGALSIQEFNTYQLKIKDIQFRILFTDPHEIPPGMVLINSNIKPNLQEEVRQIFNQTPSVIANDAGFLPNTPIPDYKYMISVVERITTIFPPSKHYQKPVRLF